MKTGIHYKVPVNIKILKEGVVPPRYAHPTDACFDIAAAEDVTIKAGETKLIATGFAVEIPDGFEMVIRPRSGMSLKTELTIKNSPGTIDESYRGEVKIIVKNNGENDISISEGMRIAQGGIRPIFQAEFKIMDELNDSARGEDGFGSTGTHVKEKN